MGEATNTFAKCAVQHVADQLSEAQKIEKQASIVLVKATGMIGVYKVIKNRGTLETLPLNVTHVDKATAEKLMQSGAKVVVFNHGYMGVEAINFFPSSN